MEQVTFDEQGFGTAGRRLAWADVVAVAIHTTADGPYAEDVYWQFLMRDGFLELPDGFFHGELIGALQTWLPGLDNLKLIRAMGSTSERIFRVWHREESPRALKPEQLEARFIALIGRLGGDVGAAPAVAARLRAAWGDAARRYHDLEHLGDCLRELDDAGLERSQADLAELALWYHDAVYEPRGRDCEERSAALLISDALAMGLSAQTAHEAAGLVRATAHFSDVPRSALAALVCDVDLAILGRDPLRFMDYEFSVEEEHARVPAFLFFRRRRQLLSALLDAPFIFRTARFRERLEAAARRNLTALLKSSRY